MAGLPTAAPFGSPPFNPAVTLDELWRNVLYDAGSTETPTELHGILKALDLTLFLGLTKANPNVGLGTTNTIGATLARTQVNVATLATTTGTLLMTGVYLPANLVVSNLNIMIGTTGDTGPSHQWMGLYNSSRVQLATSADATSTALTASTVATYPIATTAAGASTNFTTTYAGLHYVGFMIATSNSPTLAGFTGIATVLSLPPIMNGTSDTSQAGPPAFAHTAGTITATAAIPYMILT